MSDEKVIDTKITRFGYIVDKKTLTEEQVKQLKKELTVKPFKPADFSMFIKKDDSFPVYVENGDYIGIPKYFGIEKFGMPKINKLESYEYPTFKMEYSGKMRPNQEAILEKVCKSFDDPNGRGGIIVCGCGSGKTNMAIWLACKYKLKTLFLVHKEFLMNQFVNRVKSFTNCKEVGLIKQNKVETDHPFVVGMVQSIMKRDYDDKIFKDFGLIIIDEVHHMGARNFSKVYQKLTAKYMLGISAERDRNDRTYGIINWYMGPILHAEEQKPNSMVVVKKYSYNTSNEKRMQTVKLKGTETPDRSTMISNLVHIKRRNRFILSLIEELYDQGKNILFLTGRLTQISVLYKLLEQNEYIKGNIGTYVGSMKQAQLDESSTKQIILGTYSMAAEGLDIVDLNALILATPMSKVNQPIGRILRKDMYEENPLVIDIVDNGNQIFNNQSYKRDKYYHQQKYNIQTFHVTDFKNKAKKHEMWNDEEFIKQSLTKPPDAQFAEKPKTRLGRPEFSEIRFVD